MNARHPIAHCGMRGEERALQSRGRSSEAIYKMVARALRQAGKCGVLLDVGCGNGELRGFISHQIVSYVGADIARYEDYPADAEFHRVNLDCLPTPLTDGFADVVAAVETIEHLENPRALMRELVRLCRPGGRVVVTTPNQLSLASKVSLLVRNQFVAFQEAPGLYPTHITALLEIDLIRIARECGLVDCAVYYSDSGRIPLTPWHWPSALRGRTFSDNVGLLARRPEVRS
jgi:2-polyprenyl-3-methyl-5-hydroxy-6-metoxy-1,4-benzoquinol methylase